MAVQTPAATATTRLFPFSLKGTDERIYRLGDIRGENGTLLMFICNHCPYVRAVIDRVVQSIFLVERMAHHQ